MPTCQSQEMADARALFTRRVSCEVGGWPASAGRPSNFLQGAEYVCHPERYRGNDEDIDATDGARSVERLDKYAEWRDRFATRATQSVTGSVRSEEYVNRLRGLVLQRKAGAGNGIHRHRCVRLLRKNQPLQFVRSRERPDNTPFDLPAHQKAASASGQVGWSTQRNAQFLGADQLRGSSRCAIDAHCRRNGKARALDPNLCTLGQHSPRASLPGIPISSRQRSSCQGAVRSVVHVIQIPPDGVLKGDTGHRSSGSAGRNRCGNSQNGQAGKTAQACQRGRDRHIQMRPPKVATPIWSPVALKASTVTIAPNTAGSRSIVNLK